MKPDQGSEPSSIDLPAPTADVMPPMSQLNPEVASMPAQGELPIQAELPQAAPPPVAGMGTPGSDGAMLPVASSVPTATATPVMADDADLIEKEWVERAKAIVANTREDPYLQNKELSNFKAGYMKKRYNKDLPVGE